MKSLQSINLGIRFLLELAAIFIFGFWGYHQGEGSKGIILTIALPIGFMILWGIFAVRNDPSRSGKTVVQTPGMIRLLLELILFAAAVFMMFDLGYEVLAGILGGITLAHYIISYDRVLWLLRQY